MELPQKPILTSKSNTPWCEKYRPIQMSAIVLDPLNKKIFDNILHTKNFPHLLFYGPPGVGKTTTADNLVTAFQELTSKRNKETIIHLNASDERGIEVIRNQINQFVRSNNMFAQGLKFVILDEVDYMTKNAQQALKNLLQSCLDNVRFILICNYICKIDESLQNEFTCIRFNQLPESNICDLIREIVSKEELTLSDHSIQSIQTMFQSDIRSMINYIQLNQNNLGQDLKLFHNDICETLHQKWKTRDSDIPTWLYKCSVSYSTDIRTMLTKYTNYIIQMHPELVCHDFLNTVELVIHTQDQIQVEYFVKEIQQIYNTVYKKSRGKKKVKNWFKVFPQTT